VPRWLRREVAERLRFDGTVLRDLDTKEAKQQISELGREGIEALAICLLHSYANPQHEQAIRDLAKALLPDAYVTASCDLLPRFREYERLSTTVVNAYLGPLMNRYLDELAAITGRAGLGAALHVMQSNGGLALPKEARSRPASTVLSGPAAGAAAAADLCARIDVRRAIALDMGGTSTDLCVIEGGLPAVAGGREVGGCAVELPGVDIRCIGAGGGSILALDPGGLPQVGPRSAGADPGPVCYQRGGEEPTLTDALLALGRLDPNGLLSGTIPLSVDAANRAISDHIASALGVSVDRAALGAVELAVANVLRAARGITVAEGRDPRDYVLLAAGGAGPLIACEVAAELDVDEVVIPPWPGSFSACGLLASELRRDWTKTHLVPAAPEALAELRRGLDGLEREAQEWLAGTAAPDTRGILLRGIAARYVGQDYELDVEIHSREIDEESLDMIVAGFHAAHEGRYGYALPHQPVELVGLRVTAMQKVAAVLGKQAGPSRKLSADRTGSRLIYLGGQEGRVEASVVDRAALDPGDCLDGPAIIQQYDSTAYLPPGFRARTDRQGNLRARAACP
jgi:N-methylhydantoinase A